MARPSDREATKSEVLNIRVTPDFKVRMQTLVRIKGLTASKWCEIMLMRALIEEEAGATEETEELLSEIRRLIGEIEAQTEARWHKGVGTWAAVREMLASGPIIQRAPRHLGEQDERFQGVLTKIRENVRKSEELERSLALIFPPSQNALMAFVPLRERIEMLEAEQSAKDTWLALADELDRLADEQRGYWVELEEIIQPFHEAVEKGRALYPQEPRGALLAAILKRFDPKPNALLSAIRHGPVTSRSVTPPPVLGGKHLGAHSERHDYTGSAAG